MTFSFRKNLAYLHQTNPRKYRHIKRRIAIPNFREGMKTSCNWTWLLIQAVSNLCWHMFCITICVFGATCLEVKHVTKIIEEYLSVVFYFILSQITLCSIQRRIYWVKYITSIDKVWMFIYTFVIHFKNVTWSARMDENWSIYHILFMFISPFKSF